VATPTYELLDSTTLASAASSVSFTSIDQSYGDLVLVVEAESTQATPKLRFNSDSGSNYSYVDMQGISSGNTNSSSGTLDYLRIQVANIKAAPSLFIVQIMDYSATDKHKSSLSRTSADETDATRVGAVAGRWANTSAITSLAIEASVAQTFDTGSSFYLYGIAK